MVEPAPDVTRLIDRLVDDGLVERFLSEEDRRLSMSKITKKGMNLLTKINPKIDDLLIAYSSSLSKNEMDTVSNLLEKLYAKEIDS
jgi:DNA-binding MarR family transcriptional regulator